MYRNNVMLRTELRSTHYMVSHQGRGGRGRVVRMPRVAGSKEWKNEYFSYNLIFCAQQVLDF